MDRDNAVLKIRHSQASLKISEFTSDFHWDTVAELPNMYSFAAEPPPSSD